MRHDFPDLRFLTGIRVPINTFTLLNDSSFDITVPSDFDEFIISVRNLTVTTNDTTLLLQIDTGGGFHVSANDYQSTIRSWDNATTSNTVNTAIICGARLGSASDEGYNAEIKIVEPGDGTNPFSVIGHGGGSGSGTTQGLANAFGGRADPDNDAARATSIRLSPAAGTFSGKLIFYGINTSI